MHAKLQNGDMIAQDVVYHKACLSGLYRTASNKQLGGYFSDGQRRFIGIAFCEVVVERNVLLKDLLKQYNTHLSQLDVTLEVRICSTRFKNRLLAQFEDLSAYNDKEEVFSQDIRVAIAIAAERNYDDDDGYILAKAANIVRFVKCYEICIVVCRRFELPIL